MEGTMQHKRFGGNGSGGGTVVREPLASGWVVYRSGDATFDQDKLIKAIFQTIQKDLVENPNVRARFIVPIQKNGDTVSVVMGYDQDQKAQDEKGG
jgi:hypothetical protein